MHLQYPRVKRRAPRAVPSRSTVLHSQGVATPCCPARMRPLPDRFHRSPVPPPLTATTPIQQLRLRPLVAQHLRERGIGTLLDLSATSIDELRGTPGLGALTIERLRVLLRSAGLDLGEPADPVHRAIAQAESARRMRSATRALHICDASPVADLGPGRAALRRCWSRDIATVGQLRANSMQQLVAQVGPRAALDLAVRLREVGLRLEGNGCADADQRIVRAGVRIADYLDTAERS